MYTYTYIHTCVPVTDQDNGRKRVSVLENSFSNISNVTATGGELEVLAVRAGLNRMGGGGAGFMGAGFIQDGEAWGWGHPSPHKIIEIIDSSINYWRGIPVPPSPSPLPLPMYETLQGSII